MKLNIQPGQSRGFVLLEIILAIGLFAVVATAMVAALDKLSGATVSARKEAVCLRRLESVITEIQHSRSFRTGVVNFPADGSGVAIRAEINPENLVSEDGEPLSGLYRVTATAQFPGNDEFLRSMEVTIFRL